MIQLPKSKFYPMSKRNTVFVPSLLALVIVLHILKGIVTSVIVPLWEFPDEQAHFAQLAHYVEHGLNITHGKNVNQEIFEAEKVMGTLRDERGRNNYTQDVYYRPLYSDSTIGPNENHIRNLTLDDRKKIIPNKDEAPRYPPLFYLVSTFGYRLFYNSDLFTRVFFSRMASVLMSAGTVATAYAIGKQLSGNKKSLIPIALASITSFHPMFSFVSSGINNDNASNLIGALVILITLSILNTKATIKKTAVYGLTLGIGALTKASVYPVYIASFIILGYEWFQSKRSLKEQIIVYVPFLGLSILGGGWFLLKPWIQTGQIPYLATVKETSAMPELTFFQFLKPQLQLYYRETLVWYWGVFKWLSVILPLNVIRGVKVVMALSFFGLIKIFVFGKSRQMKKNIVALAVFSVVFVLIITYWDYQFFRDKGFRNGIQGRYFFPVLTAHMGLMLLGIRELVSQKFSQLMMKLCIVGMAILHTISLHTIANNYYQLQPLSSLVLQMSQYKPVFLKTPYLFAWVSIYGLLSIYFGLQLIRKK